MKKALLKIIYYLIRPFFYLAMLVFYIPYRLGIFEFVSISRFLALIPSFLGVSLRRAWYEMTLKACGKNLYVDWMAAIKTPKTSVGNNVFIGTFSWVGWAAIGDDVMLGGHNVILSGKHHHSFDRLDVPIRAQATELSQVKIGDDVWIGNGAIIMSDISNGCVVGAGAVVNKAFPGRSILAGVPAALLRKRGK